MTKKGILLLIAVVAIGAYTAVDWSCTGNPKHKVSQIMGRQGHDCEAEYRQIADRDYFFSAAGAVDACDTFLSHFQYQRCAHNDEVRAMREAFAAMGEALGRSYYSYELFKSETRYLSQHLAESPYRVVRDTWARLLREEDSWLCRASAQRCWQFAGTNHLPLPQQVLGVSARLCAAGLPRAVWQGAVCDEGEPNRTAPTVATRTSRRHCGGGVHSRIRHTPRGGTRAGTAHPHRPADRERRVGLFLRRETNISQKRIQRTIKTELLRLLKLKIGTITI